MVPDVTPGPGTRARTYLTWLACILTVVLPFALFPLPDSPFLLGMSLAFLLWVVTVYDGRKSR